ncbi:MAG: 16S rRNA processing protein RimM [Clostridia bacterium]|nr:16S rRNA processing protein RimM [Clostridia bacterium]
MKQYLEIGRIVSTHGVKGEFHVDLWCDNAAFAKQFKVMYLGGSKTPLSVSPAKPRGHNQIIVKAKGVDSIDDAKLLIGNILYFDRKDAKLPAGTYFQSDLIGLEVRDADDGRVYGTLSDVYPTGANDVYTVKTPDGREVLIPAIRQVVVKVELEEGIMTIRPLEGLFDEN